MRSRAKSNKLKRSITLALIIALPILCIMLLNTNSTKGDKQAIFGSLAENLEDENKVLISTLEDLKDFRNNVNAGTDYSGKEVILVADIECNSDEKWVPIGTTDNPFKGIFNGNGFTISKYILAEDAEGRAGLFGLTEGTIKNLKVEIDQEWNASNFNEGNINDLTIHRYVGSIAAENNGTITNCVVNETIGETEVNVTDNEIDRGNEQDEPVWKKITTNIASNKGIEFSAVSNDINDNIYFNSIFTIGGLVGKNVGKIEECENDAKIFARNLKINGGLGGIAGESDKGQIINCTNRGNLQSTYNVGGIVGILQDSEEDDRGILSDTALVQNCLNYGSINKYRDVEIRYFKDVEQLTNLEDDGQYASGPIPSVTSVGGIVGELRNAKVDHCKNSGYISGFDKVSGIVGNIDGTKSKMLGVISGSLNEGCVYGITNVRRHFGICR